jgi:branched-chain amino acid transport system ATP-binding protein
MAGLLKVANLTKTFGGLVAVDNVSFDLDAGEMLGVVGPNGAGKTTVFNLLTGFLKASSGSIRFNGKDITRLEPHWISLLGISRTFQQVRYFQGMTVLETVTTPVILRKGNVKKAAAEALEAVGLKGKEDVLSKSLTYLELKSLEIARAIVTGPSLLLLDEPFGGLAREETEGIAKILKRLHEEKRTAIIIEHRLGELVALVERLMVMNFGKKIADGQSKEVLDAEHVIEAYVGRGWKSH